MAGDRIRTGENGYPVLLGHPWRRTAGSASEVARRSVTLSDGRTVALPDGVSEHELRLALDDQQAPTDQQDHDDDEKEHRTVNLSDSEDNAPLSDLVPLREATRMHPSLMGRIEIVRRGSERYVKRSELEALIGRTSRGGMGAGQRIANALSDATARRAQTMKRGQDADRERASAARRRVSERRRAR